MQYLTTWSMVNLIISLIEQKSYPIVARIHGYSNADIAKQNPTNLGYAGMAERVKQTYAILVRQVIALAIIHFTIIFHR